MALFYMGISSVCVFYMYIITCKSDDNSCLLRPKLVHDWRIMLHLSRTWNDRSMILLGGVGWWLEFRCIKKRIVGMALELAFD